MSGNLISVRDMSGIDQKSGKCWGKNYVKENFLLVNFTFGAAPVFSSMHSAFLHFCNALSSIIIAVVLRYYTVSFRVGMVVLPNG